MKTPKRQKLLMLSICSCSIFVAFAALLGTAKAAQPVVVGSIITNQFQVTITNGTNGAVYEILWTPLLSNPLYLVEASRRVVECLRPQRTQLANGA